jgi:MFS superfamily sulfate permease-like transporter
VVHNFIERAFAIASQFLRVHPVVMGVGFAGLTLLWLGEKFLASRPIALLLVVISVAFVSMTNLASHVVMVGEIPSGLPSFSPPMPGRNVGRSNNRPVFCLKSRPDAFSSSRSLQTHLF